MSMCGRVCVSERVSILYVHEAKTTHTHTMALPELLGALRFY